MPGCGTGFRASRDFRGQHGRTRRIHPQGHHEAVQLLGGGPVDVQLGRFGNDFDIRAAVRKRVADHARANGDRARRRSDAPQQLGRGAFDGPVGQIVAAQAVQLRRGTLGLAPHGGGERQGDGRQRRRKPQDRQQRAAPACARVSAA